MSTTDDRTFADIAGDFGHWERERRERNAGMADGARRFVHAINALDDGARAGLAAVVASLRLDEGGVDPRDVAAAIRLLGPDGIRAAEQAASRVHIILCWAAEDADCLPAD